MSEASELPTATCDGWSLVLFVKLGCQRLEIKGGEIMRNHILYIHIINYREGDPVRPCNFHKKHYFSESPLIHNTRQSKMQRYEMAEHET